MRTSVHALAGSALLAIAMPGQASSHEAALYRNHTLLTLESDGRVLAWSEGATVGAPYDAPSGVRAICSLGGELFVVTALGDEPGRREIGFWSGESGAWKSEARFRETDDDRFIALDCSGAEPLLLTGQNLRVPRSGVVRPIAGEALEPGHVTTLQSGGYLYVGLYFGEWGGGLRRYALRDGAVEAIDASDPNDLCGGPLNKSCDPVTGLAPDPGDANCILASVGLEHFLPHGSLLRVCDKSIETVYSKPFEFFERDGPEGQDQQSPDDFPSVAFYSIASKGTAVWVAGMDGLYRLGKDSKPDFMPFDPQGRIPASGIDWSNPDFILVSTYVSNDRSLVGHGLILVPREN